MWVVPLLMCISSVQHQCLVCPWITGFESRSSLLRLINHGGFCLWMSNHPKDHIQNIHLSGDSKHGRFHTQVCYLKLHLILIWITRCKDCQIHYGPFWWIGRTASYWLPYLSFSFSAKLQSKSKIDFPFHFFNHERQSVLHHQSERTHQDIFSEQAVPPQKHSDQKIIDYCKKKAKTNVTKYEIKHCVNHYFLYENSVQHWHQWIKVQTEISGLWGEWPKIVRKTFAFKYKLQVAVIEWTN